MPENKRLIGRNKEQQYFERVLAEKAPAFLAVYGRRRVGKTYLIREYFKSRGLYLEITGMKDGSLDAQLGNFKNIIQDQFYPGTKLQVPSTWIEAFEMLDRELHKCKNSQKIILFFDELPWLASAKSNFVGALDYYWNTRWSKSTNVILIVCGSAASWMIEKIVYAKGGLHNRLTGTIHLLPFNLSETKDYLRQKNSAINNAGILDVYMLMGGVPYYLQQIDNKLSVAQNINRLFFTRDGNLFDEFHKLYASLYNNADIYEDIILAIGKHRAGVSIEDLVRMLKVTTGGRFRKRLRELEDAGFIANYLPYGQKKNQYYRIIDEYTSFYQRWLQGLRSNQLSATDQKYWLKKINTQEWYSWAGYCFENVCYKHIPQIAKALELDQIPYQTGSWKSTAARKSQQQGAQIDLLFDRDDGVITLCEIKYTHKQPLRVDKALAFEMIRKKELFQAITKTKKAIQLCLIANNGIVGNAWSEELGVKVVTFADLLASV